MAISVSMLLLFSRFATSLLMDLFSFFFFGSIHPQDQVIETTFLTNCFGEASITSVLFLSHLKDTAHTIGKGRDSLYFHFSFSSCSPAFLVRPSTIKEEGDFFFLTSPLFSLLVYPSLLYTLWNIQLLPLPSYLMWRPRKHFDICINSRLKSQRCKCSALW